MAVLGYMLHTDARPLSDFTTAPMSIIALTSERNASVSVDITVIAPDSPAPVGSFSLLQGVYLTMTIAKMAHPYDAFLVLSLPGGPPAFREIDSATGRPSHTSVVKSRAGGAAIAIRSNGVAAKIECQIPFPAGLIKIGQGELLAQLPTVGVGQLGSQDRPSYGVSASGTTVAPLGPSTDHSKHTPKSGPDTYPGDYWLIDGNTVAGELLWDPMYFDTSEGLNATSYDAEGADRLASSNGSFDPRDGIFSWSGNAGLTPRLHLQYPGVDTTRSRDDFQSGILFGAAFAAAIAASQGIPDALDIWAEERHPRKRRRWQRTSTVSMCYPDKPPIEAPTYGASGRASEDGRT